MNSGDRTEAEAAAMTMTMMMKTMNDTGIGYAGIDGAWWLPAVAPFTLPRGAQVQLNEINQAIFALFDEVGALYDTAEGNACGLTALLRHKVPAHLQRFASRAPVLGVRPDFQLRMSASSEKPEEIDTVATELEICPSAQGYAHAMQLGHDLPTDLLQAMLRLLNGRELIFVSTQHWSEFIWEQLAFCKALVQAGGRARVWLDIPINILAAQVQQRLRWEPPLFGVPHKPDRWDIDVLARIHARDFAPYIAEQLPFERTDVVVFRFGYLDCFAPELLVRLHEWEQIGASFINPTSFLWDSKAVMAALQLPALRQRLSLHHRNTVDVLDHCIPETHLLADTADMNDTFRHLLNTPDQWVLKFAGFDSGQQAWGGRSLQMGAQHSAESWQDIVRRYAALPFPTIAQRISPTMQMGIDYVAYQAIHTLTGRARLRSFLMRDVGAVGTHLTVADGQGGVSEGLGAVQTPVRFG